MLSLARTEWRSPLALRGGGSPIRIRKTRSAVLLKRNALDPE